MIGTIAAIVPQPPSSVAPIYTPAPIVPCHVVTYHANSTASGNNDGMSMSNSAAPGATDNNSNNAIGSRITLDNGRRNGVYHGDQGSGSGSSNRGHIPGTQTPPPTVGLGGGQDFARRLLRPVSVMPGDRHGGISSLLTEAARVRVSVGLGVGARGGFVREAEGVDEDEDGGSAGLPRLCDGDSLRHSLGFLMATDLARFAMASKAAKDIALAHASTEICRRYYLFFTRVGRVVSLTLSCCKLLFFSDFFFKVDLRVSRIQPWCLGEHLSQIYVVQGWTVKCYCPLLPSTFWHAHKPLTMNMDLTCTVVF